MGEGRPRPLAPDVVSQGGRARCRGASLLETVLALAVLATLAGLAVPNVARGRDALAIDGAARYLASRVWLARAEAARRGAAVALVFDRVDDTYRESMVVDGNDNGIRKADIRRGVDVPLDEGYTLSAMFPGVRFALSAAVASVGSSRPAGGRTDPIRLGASDVLTVTPLGTATSGTLYLRSRTGRQYALRVLGPTARVRLLTYDISGGVWLER